MAFSLISRHTYFLVISILKKETTMFKNARTFGSLPRGTQLVFGLVTSLFIGGMVLIASACTDVFSLIHHILSEPMVVHSASLPTTMILALVIYSPMIVGLYFWYTFYKATVTTA
jgi:hypothetical protein